MEGPGPGAGAGVSRATVWPVAIPPARGRVALISPFLHQPAPPVLGRTQDGRSGRARIGVYMYIICVSYCHWQAWCLTGGQAVARVPSGMIVALAANGYQKVVRGGADDSQGRIHQPDLMFLSCFC